ncbi:MAG: aldehyde dehydrogenase family protein, partial [Algoriphagus sp.]
MIDQQTTISKQDSAKEIFQSQKKTALDWRLSTFKERIARIKLIRDWVKENKVDIQNAIFEDFKKPAAETDLSEVFPITSEINHTISKLGSWMKPQKVGTPLAMIGTSGKIIYEPKGVSLIIGPWNYPFN